MMRDTRAVLLRLNVDDRELLRLIAQYVAAPEQTVLRWALRHYALCGPWCPGGGLERRQALRDPGPLETGPRWEEVAP